MLNLTAQNVTFVMVTCVFNLRAFVNGLKLKPGFPEFQIKLLVIRKLCQILIPIIFFNLLISMQPLLKKITISEFFDKDRNIYNKRFTI